MVNPEARAAKTAPQPEAGIEAEARTRTEVQPQAERQPQAAAQPQPQPEAETVVIQVPPDADYLAIIRSASAHVATKLGCTLAEVSDLRLAVDEACGLLLRHTVRDKPSAGSAGGAGDLECRFILQGTALRAVLSLRARDAAAPQNDEFGWTILSALVDDIVWRVDAPMVHVELLKRHAVGG